MNRCYLLHKYVRDDVNADEEVEEPDHVAEAHQPIIDQWSARNEPRTKKTSVNLNYHALASVLTYGISVSCKILRQSPTIEHLKHSLYTMIH